MAIGAEIWFTSANALPWTTAAPAIDNAASASAHDCVMWRMHGTTLGLVIQTREDEK